MGADRRRGLKATSAETDTPCTKDPAGAASHKNSAAQTRLRVGGDRATEKVVVMGEASSKKEQAEVTETTSLRGGAVCLPDAFIPWNLSGHGVDVSAWPAFF